LTISKERFEGLKATEMISRFGRRLRNWGYLGCGRMGKRGKVLSALM